MALNELQATPLEADASTVESTDLDSLLSSLKSLETAELFKVLKGALSEAQKKALAASKGVKADKSATKRGSMPKGKVPPQLRKPRAWVDFVLANALENGWSAFTVHQTHKDKVTGEVIEEEIEMPGSILHDGAHVYEGSVSEKSPNGKQLINKDAMSLSKHYWAPKEQKGTRPELYAEFEASYTEPIDDVSETASVTSSKKVVKMTAAERTALAEEKKAAKEAEKETKKAEKEAEKLAKKADKEAEKEAKKAEKEAEKQAKKEAKEAEKASKVAVKKGVKVVTKAVPVAALKSAPAPTSVKPAPAPTAVKPATVPTAVKTAPASTAVKPAPAPAVVKTAPEAWSCPADGMVHAWPYKGKNYLRNSDNEVWLRSVDGGCGAWQGIYIPAEDHIDDSIPEPMFEEEE